MPFSSSLHKKITQILSFSCVHLYALDCSYFPLILFVVSKNTGVRPLGLFKKSDFEGKTPDKRIGEKMANIVHVAKHGKTHVIKQYL